jgi:hypothetical protein
VTLHRLNRTEYNNTVRDLLGTSLRPATDFPQDEFGFGFDNNADVLTLSPVHLELYQRAAEALATDALRKGGDRSQVVAPALTDFSTSASVVLFPEGLFLLRNAETSVNLRQQESGKYQVIIKAYGEQVDPDPVRMALHINGIRVQTYDVTATWDAPKVYEATVDLASGPNRLSIVFLNDFEDPMAGLDRNLGIKEVRVTGPLGVLPDGPARERLLSCPLITEPVPCAQDILRRFATRAYRRPVDADELSRLVGLAQLAWREGGAFEDGVRLAVQAALLSPNFLFRAELDQDPASPVVRPLNAYELAARLSYFLWSTMPDDMLFSLAESGALLQRDVLRAQVERMLDAPQAQALLDNFATQWLQLRELDASLPDRKLFPSFDDTLRKDMQRESLLFFGHFLGREAPPAQGLLTADYTFLSARLARHYGYAFQGPDFVKTPLAGTARSGLLGQGSVLTLTSFPARTSPVKRGKWVLEQLLCSAPPAPPVAASLEEGGTVEGTLRQRLEEHRKNPQCASCHRLMDPIGFGLENFDAVGAYRTMDGAAPVDSSGELPNGQRFSGARELAALLTADGRFARCLTEKVFSYALGRGPAAHDEARLTGLAEEFTRRGSKLRDLIHLITESDAFLTRRGDANGGQP